MTTHTWTTLLELYATTQRAAGRSPGTIRLHRHYLGHVASAHPDVSTITREDLEAWLAAPFWKPETRKSARSVVVVFFRWAFDAEYLPVNPAAHIRPVRVPQAVARPAPDDAYRAALASADESVRLMLKLARHAGLRCAEIAAVHSGDLTGDLLHVTGKGGKQRVVPLYEPELVEAIPRARGYLFPSPRGGHILAGTVSHLLGEALPHPWTAHQLRHAFASQSYAASHDLFALGRVLGHSKPETTLRYVATPADALRAVVAAAAPAGEAGR